MTRYRVTVTNGYAGCDQEYEEETDLTGEELAQEIWQNECDRIQVSVELIEEDLETQIITELSDDEIADIAAEAASINSGTMTDFYYGEKYDNLSKELQEQVVEKTYELMDDCDYCGWSYEASEIEYMDSEHGEKFCGRCSIEVADLDAEND